jgi:hypothetical protein
VRERESEGCFTKLMEEEDDETNVVGGGGGCGIRPPISFEFTSCTIVLTH